MSARPPKAPSALKQIWYKWKTLRLPWRRQFLAGSDLAGNTFWEFKDAMNAQRFRRIVKYSKAGHYSDVKISRKCCESLRATLEDANDQLQQRNGINGYDTHATNPPQYKSRHSTSPEESA
jgi:NADH dehydrogenase [ubiquinone] 1 alpha subcomplex assembly factor 2